VLLDGRSPGAGIWWAVATGLGGTAAVAAFYRALAVGTMSIVAPIAAAGSIVPVLVGMADGDRPSSLQVAGIAVAFIGIVLAAREPGRDRAHRNAGRGAIGLSLVAGVAFGATFVGLDRATEAEGVAWTLLAARGVQLLVFGAIALVVRPALPRSVRDASPLLALGALDLLANALFALATTQGLLSIVSVVGSLYPAVTVVLARAILNERITRAQEAGVLATLAGVVAISAG
jgi:drug/metabolite transporter (DMT)-like permease